MSFKNFIQNESSKDAKLEKEIKQIVSKEIDYKNIKFGYSDNQMMVYITPEDKDEDCLKLGKKLEKLFKNKIPGFIVYNDTQNKGSFTIDLSVETLKESESEKIPAPFVGVIKRFNKFLNYKIGNIDFVKCYTVGKKNLNIVYKSTKSNKENKLAYKVADKIRAMFGHLFIANPVISSTEGDDLITVSIEPKEFWFKEYGGTLEKVMEYLSSRLNEESENLEIENITLSEEVQQILSERPSLIVKAGRLKKLRKYHKTSQFKNVIHKKNLRALKTAAGIKKKKAKKRYMKKYTRKYGKIMALRAKKYQNIVKESFLNEKLKFIKELNKYGVNNLVFDRPLTKFMLDLIIEKGELKRYSLGSDEKKSVILKDGVPEYGIATLSYSTYLHSSNAIVLTINVLTKEGTQVTVAKSDYSTQICDDMIKFKYLQELFEDDLKINVGSDLKKFFQKLAGMKNEEVFDFITKKLKDSKEVKLYDPEKGLFQFETKKHRLFKLNTKQSVFGFYRGEDYTINYTSRTLFDTYEVAKKLEKLFGFECLYEKNLERTETFFDFQKFGWELEKQYKPYRKEDVNPFIEKLNTSLLDIAKKSKLDLIFSDLTCDYDSSDKKYLNVSFKITRDLKE